MIWSLIKSLFWAVLKLAMPKRASNRKIRQLQEKVDELTTEITEVMSNRPVNRKRLNQLRFDRRVLNRRIARLRRELRNK
jgi:peptidoglycan hydrolase CwlO-like protein